jgi:altronate dehydratase
MPTTVTPPAALDPAAHALTLHDGDDVAVMVSEGKPGQTCEVRSHDGQVSTLKLQTVVPFGHKLAIRAVAKGGVVIKYGQPIGLALEAIALGVHVHTHNMGGYRSSLLGVKA